VAGRDIQPIHGKSDHIGLQMNPIPSLDTEHLLRKYGLHPDKRIGQNFLNDTDALEKIVMATDICSTDTVLEIGPGLGSLTRHLSISAQQVIAVELDPKLIPILQTVLKDYANVHTIHGNILDLTPKDLGLPANYIVAANIPYNITSAIIRHLLESEPRPRRVVLTIQKEVAERVCAAPPDMSLLSLSVQVYGSPQITAYIPAEAFHPAPKVDSAIVKIETYPGPLIPTSLLPVFFKLIKAGFNQKRKTLRNSLSAGLEIPAADAELLLSKAEIDSKRRAETLSLQEWGYLCQIGIEAEMHLTKPS
jgi:16S rRNA (adenine1518-N6/adenine1519-N6)-dimethyltransferase